MSYIKMSNFDGNTVGCEECDANGEHFDGAPPCVGCDFSKDFTDDWEGDFVEDEPDGGDEDIEDWRDE